jgi:hypothetical protein
VIWASGRVEWNKGHTLSVDENTRHTEERGMSLDGERLRQPPDGTSRAGDWQKLLVVNETGDSSCSCRRLLLI